MAYKTYISEALVCGSRAKNTSDKSYLLFTREAGMLYASAKSVREERSKQRYSLQEFSYIRVTLVQGKSGWRVTGAEPVMNIYANQSTREARALVRNIIRLLRRLIQGESPHQALFDETKETLVKTHGGNEESIEKVLTLRVLHSLGYIAPVESLAHIFTGNDIDTIVATLSSEMRGECQTVIEHALQESHL